METACVFVVPRGMHPSASTPLLVPGVVSKPPGWPLECASGGDEGEDVERTPAAAALPAGQLPVSRAAVSPASVARSLMWSRSLKNAPSRGLASSLAAPTTLSMRLSQANSDVGSTAINYTRSAV